MGSEAVLKYTSIIKNENGSVLVFVTLIMINIIAAVGLVVDVGYVYLEKQKIQNALDAAALAGIQELPDTYEARLKAIDYAVLNGVKESELEISFPGSNQIQLKSNRNINLFFMPVLNISHVNVNTTSAAQLCAASCFGYTLFSGSNTKKLSLNGNNIYINGSSHSNYKFRANGHSIAITSMCNATGSISVNGNDIQIPYRSSYGNTIEMPDFTNEIKQQAETAGIVENSSVHYNGNSINIENSLYVNGDVHLNGNSISGTGALLAENDIHINGNCIKNSSNDAICLYAKNGDITVNGNNIHIEGILYAPEGNIKLNGNNITIEGKVIGKEININGNDLQVNDDDIANFVLPCTSYKLVL